MLEAQCLAQTTSPATAQASPKPWNEYPGLEFKETRMKIEPRVPAGLPIVFELDILNLSDKRVQFWSTGPGTYPQGNEFSVTINDGIAPPKKITPENGQYMQGRMDEKLIGPGECLQIPLCIDPLPPGKYKIEVTSGNLRWSPKRVAFPDLKPTSAKFEVVADVKLSEQWVAYELHRRPKRRSVCGFCDFLEEELFRWEDEIIADLRSKNEARH